MQIDTGPNKGFYKLSQQVMNDNSLVRTNTVYSKWKLPRNEKVYGFNSSWLPFMDGYYFVPRIQDTDIRKLLYALKTKHMPSSGNTETFQREFNRVVVPDNYCPFYLDPCKYDWCEKCKNGITIEKPYENNISLISTIFNSIKHTINIVLCFLLISIIIVQAIK